MNDIVNIVVDLCDPVEAYVRPIRSVLFIDDQFPTFGQSAPGEASEAERARALWQACTEQGWLCDVDNSADWSTEQRQRRLASCDLLVLDYHLSGNDSGPALAIIRELARSETPNLVVVYTAHDKLDDVLIAVAASARGAAASAFDLEIEEEEIKVDWTRDDILAFITGNRRWMRTYGPACTAAGQGVIPAHGESLLERWIATNFGAQPHESPLTVERIECSLNRWFQCGNLFVVVIGKPAEQLPEQEAKVVLNGLEAAIKAWAPPWLACLVASSRRNIEAGAFRDDAILPAASLQRGLLRYILATDDSDERGRRTREIATYLLNQRFNRAVGAMSQQIRQRAEVGSSEPSADEDKAHFLHLNAFLCSEAFHRHHLRVGTIFRAKGSNAYWICVTPACDMVPRDRKKSIDPWPVELDPFRPMLALRLERCRGDQVSTALRDAEKGRYVFFWDSAVQKDTPIVAACFNTVTGDPNPRLEQMFASDRARVRDDKVLLQRCVRDLQGSLVVLERVECDVVGQLRAPYAERLAHVVGYHLSRIGVNFLRMGDHDPEEQD